MGRVNIVKQAVLSKAIDRVNATSIKISIHFHRNYKKSAFGFIWKYKKSRIFKTLLNNKWTTAANTIPDIAIKAAWYWHKKKYVYQWIWIEVTDIYAHEFLIKKLKIHTRESIFNKRCLSNRMIACRRRQIYLYLSPCQNSTPSGWKTATEDQTLWTW